MNSKIDVSAILNVHREGIICGISLASFAQSINHARSMGLAVDAIIIGDRTDELTQRMIQSFVLEDCRVYLVDFGDLAESRNYGVQQSSASYVAFLDADDLWCPDWISRCYNYSQQLERKTVLHSAFNVYFGNSNEIWVHADSEEPGFDVSYLRIANYWDSLCFSPRHILVEYPYIPYNLKLGFGYEDWNWNCITLAAGIQHRPCPKTFHLKRNRQGSLLSECRTHDVIPWPSNLTTFASA